MKNNTFFKCEMLEVGDEGRRSPEEQLGVSLVPRTITCTGLPELWNSDYGILRTWGGIYVWKPKGMGGFHRRDFWSRKSLSL